ncbi:MAG: hypothetical protein J2P25_18705 [Nocardiopsaceae bacterium]|nr:hypothetical protein [Nocardiopsaceae bacterium]
MSYRFSVDLSALERASAGVNQVLYEFGEVSPGSLTTGSDVTGNAELSGVLGDFCSRWQRGVADLASEGQQIAHRLGYAVYAYSAYEEATRHAAAEGGTVSGEGSDPAAQG